MNPEVLQACKEAQDLLNRGEPDKAVAALLDQTRQSRSWIPPMMLGVVYLEGAKRDLQGSVACSLLALERDKGHFNPWMNLGVACLELARGTIFDEVAATSCSPQKGYVWLELARVYLEKAIEILRHSPDPATFFHTEQWAKCLLFLGDSYDLEERFDEAARYGRQSVEKFESNAEACKSSAWYDRACQLAERWEANTEIHRPTP